jgi:hypothetical protein
VRRLPVPREHICLAPLGDGSAADGSVCGRPAVTEREVNRMIFPLCAEHAAELDADADDGEE